MWRKRLVRWPVIAITFVIAASWSFSLALKGGWLRRSLTAKLAATVRRPVEVGRFGFSLLGGPTFQAYSVTVGEDPRFGQEYFMRAERLSARLRWAKLVQGRIEFDRLSLSRPSLNLVRAGDGQWNAETWLPPAGEMTGHSGPSKADFRAWETEIDIVDGRINFKRGVEKLPFAFLDVSGSLNLQSGGRWLLNLQARPMRAAVMLQMPGTLRLRGIIGGMSSRLQPADLKLSWEGASLADAARLIRGTDYGLRGALDGDFAVRLDRTEDGPENSPWKIEGGIRLQAIHRWDLVSRADNPAINVKLSGAWLPWQSRVEIEHWVVEAPESSVEGEARVDWAHGFEPELTVLDSSHIGFADAVKWVRAFLPGRADEVELSGNAGLEAKFAGWPPRVEDLDFESEGASLRGAGKLGPIRIGSVKAVWSHGSVMLAAVTFRLSSPVLRRTSRGGVSEAAVPEGIFQVDGALAPIHPGDKLRDWSYRLAISGRTERLQDLRAALGSVGWQFGRNWDVEGAASVQLVCAGALRAGSTIVRGQLDMRKLRLTNSAVSEPILVSSASMEFSPGRRRVRIGDLEALGGRWSGTLERKTANTEWSFDLSADRVDLEELGREFGHNRQGLFYRLLPFGESSGLSPETEAAISRVNAQGRLHIDKLAAGDAYLESVDADADLQRGNLTLRRAEADLYGGRVSGEFRAHLGTEVSYSFRGQVDRTDLSALGALSSIKSGFGGIASGELELEARGVGRQALLASLEGEGFFHVQDAMIDLVDLPADPADTGFQGVSGSHFRSSTVSFRVENGRVHVDPWLLSGRQRELEIIGDIDFSRRVNLQVRSNSSSRLWSSATDAEPGDAVWVIGGTLDAPQVVRQERVSAGNQAARTGTR